MTVHHVDFSQRRDPEPRRARVSIDYRLLCDLSGRLVDAGLYDEELRRRVILDLEPLEPVESS